jgi:hypothetical protein
MQLNQLQISFCAQKKPGDGGASSLQVPLSRCVLLVEYKENWNCFQQMGAAVWRTLFLGFWDVIALNK